MSERPLRTLLTNLAPTICGELEEAVHITHTPTPSTDARRIPTPQVQQQSEPLSPFHGATTSD